MTSLDAFNKYAGREIAVIVGQKNYDDHKIPSYTVNENDATVAALKADAAKNGLSVSFNLPHSAKSSMVDNTRLNVSVQKDSNDKWHIQPGFTVG